MLKHFICGDFLRESEARQKVSLELIAGYLPEEISELLKATYTYWTRELIPLTRF